MEEEAPVPDPDPLVTHRRLTEADLERRSSTELDILRNEIYARHGYLFKRKDLQAHFNRQSWYRGTTRDIQSVALRLTPIERANARIIQEYQKRRGQLRSAVDGVPASPFAVQVSAGHRRTPIVCIDPGHPSEVGRGTRGRHNTELRVVWQIAEDLEARLRKDGIRVVMTKRDEGQFVTNRTRADIANRAHADLMLRLHCDAEGGTGLAVFYPDRAGKKGKDKGPYRPVITASRTAASVFHRSLAQHLRGHLKDRGLFPDIRTRVGSRQGALTGSIYSRVPVLLVEMCVLTNPADEKFITSAAGRKRMVDALALSVRAVLAGKPRTV